MEEVEGLVHKLQDTQAALVRDIAQLQKKRGATKNEADAAEVAAELTSALGDSYRGEHLLITLGQRLSTARQRYLVADEARKATAEHEYRTLSVQLKRAKETIEATTAAYAELVLPEPPGPSSADVWAVARAHEQRAATLEDEIKARDAIRIATEKEMAERVAGLDAERAAAREERARMAAREESLRAELSAQLPTAVALRAEAERMRLELVAAENARAEEKEQIQRRAREEQDTLRRRLVELEQANVQLAESILRVHGSSFDGSQEMDISAALDPTDTSWSSMSKSCNSSFSSSFNASFDVAAANRSGVVAAKMAGDKPVSPTKASPSPRIASGSKSPSPGSGEDVVARLKAQWREKEDELDQLLDGARSTDSDDRRRHDARATTDPGLATVSGMTRADAFAGGAKAAASVATPAKANGAVKTNGAGNHRASPSASSASLPLSNGATNGVYPRGRQPHSPLSLRLQRERIDIDTDDSLPWSPDSSSASLPAQPAARTTDAAAAAAATSPRERRTVARAERRSGGRSADDGQLRDKSAEREDDRRRPKGMVSGGASAAADRARLRELQARLRTADSEQLRLAEDLVMTQRASQEAAARYEAIIAEIHVALSNVQRELKSAEAGRAALASELASVNDEMERRYSSKVADLENRARAAERERDVAVREADSARSAAARTSALEVDIAELLGEYERVVAALSAMHKDAMAVDDVIARVSEAMDSAGGATETPALPEDDDFLDKVVANRERRRLRRREGWQRSKRTMGVGDDEAFLFDDVVGLS